MRDIDAEKDSLELQPPQLEIKDDPEAIVARGSNGAEIISDASQTDAFPDGGLRVSQLL